MSSNGKSPSRPGNLKIKYVVELSAEERAAVEQVLKGKVGQRRRQHAQILLKIDAGPLGPDWTNPRTAEAVGVSVQTIINVRKRLVTQGLQAVLNRRVPPRPPRFPVLDGEKEAHLIALACTKPSKGQARWTLKLLRDRLIELEIVDSVSLETVRKTLKKTT